ncbi:putative leader peptide [Pseudonocardia sp. NPDC049154]
MSQAATLRQRRHVDLRRQASAICAAPGRGPLLPPTR